MIGLLDRLGRPLGRLLDPETAHQLLIAVLSIAPLPSPLADDPRLALEVFGLRFPNPIGTAAGFDKNGAAINAVLRLGFGFVEIGTVTPLPQSGNRRPRVFRLPADGAVINRLGFNNDGFAEVLRRLARRTGPGIVGVNLGANRDSVNRTLDYVEGVKAFARLAGYLAVNISSPNTPGLRQLQGKRALEDLLARLIEARRRSGARKPLLIKIAPDLSLGELDDVVAVARRQGIDGMIVANTTTSRPRGLADRSAAAQAGGLSGRPLFALSTRMLAETFVRTEGAFPLIGVGGIDSGESAVQKIRAGAHLVQVYTGLVYQSFGLLKAIKRALLAELEARRGADLYGLVGADAAARTAEPWPH